jgi:hypothetical protein
MTLVIDRFEAVFAQPHITAQQRDALAAALDTLARCGRVLLVLACRNDFYPRIAETPELLEGKANGAHVDLSPPSRAEIAQMIRLPALAANLSFATDPDSGERLDDMLCEAAAASPDALPLLQYALQELYRLRGPGGELASTPTGGWAAWTGCWACARRTSWPASARHRARLSEECCRCCSR